MLIICNGNFKSGSTWLHFIISEILRLKEIHIFDTKEKYTNNVNSPTSIIESKLSKFLKNEDYKTNYYLTKSHYLSKKTFNMRTDNHIKFLFINRDIYDVIVSHFHHFNLRSKLKLSFQTYFFFIGKLKAYEVIMLRKLYRKFANKKNSFLYNDLINNFEDSVNKISNYLELGDFDKSQLKAIKKSTSIEIMREKINNGELTYYSQTNFKKRKELLKFGKSGNWKNYFTTKNEKTVNNILSDNTSIILKINYFIFFTLRRKILKVE
tara:strand:+ start:1399 stop:2196 length:798 start_codon:yes stop_codon:yes gene_type:complete